MASERIEPQNILKVKFLPKETVEIHKSVLYDKSISLSAKGLFCFMRSMPEDWIFYATDMSRRFKMHRKTMAKILKELLDAEYISREPLRGEQGCYMGYLYIIYPIKRKSYLQRYKSMCGEE